MPSYILIDDSGHATVIPESRIQQEATERLASGESFQVYRADPMQVEVSLSPARGGAAPAARPAKTTRRKKRRAKAGRRKKKAGARGKGKGKVGRPKVNVGACSVAGCKNPSKTRGLCSAHYQAHRRLARQGKPGLLGGAAAAPATKKKTRKKRSAKKK